MFAGFNCVIVNTRLNLTTGVPGVLNSRVTKEDIKL
jgi:hypothetical protein